MADVFLSYAREDRTQSKLVHRLLVSCGWSVFWDEHIKTSADWRRTLDAELGQARAVVVLWSRRSVASDWVKEEADIARQRGMLLSVLIDRVAPPLGFGNLQAIDLIRWQGGRTDGVNRLIAAVSETLHAPPKQDWKAPRPPPSSWKLVVGGLLLVVLAAYPLAKWLWPPAPIMNQEIVVDASEGMSTTFDQGKTKLSAAVEALRARFLHPDDNLALRVFGGECQQDNSSNLLVSFGTKRRDRILRAADGIQPHGEPTLWMGVVAALSDVARLQHTKRIVVLTGHADKCQENALRDIKDRIEHLQREGQQLELDLRLVGLGVSAEDQGRLQDVSAAVGGRAYFVNTIGDLNAVLEFVLEFEPAIVQVEKVGTLMDTIGNAMTEAARFMNDAQYNEAQRVLDSAGAIYVKMNPSFKALAGSLLTPKLVQFYRLATESRSLQQQALALGREIVRRGKPSDEQQTPEYGAAVSRWNEAVGKYNSNVYEMERLSEEMVNEAQNSVRKNSGGP